MRPLSDDELKIFFTKLEKYIGENIKFLIEDQENEEEQMVFRLIKSKVHYLSLKLLKQSSAFARDNLIHAGVVFGQFSKSKKFILHVTCLDIL